MREGSFYTRQAWCLGVWLEIEVVREQENSNVHRLVVQGKHRSGEVEQALAGEATDYFPFWYSVSIFFQQNMCFSSVCCRWLIFSPVVYSVGCRQKSLSCKERHHGWDGTICTIVAAGEFCGLLWADRLFCFLLAIVLLRCLLWLRIVHRDRGHNNRCSFVWISEEQLLYWGLILVNLGYCLQLLQFGRSIIGVLVRSCSFFFFVATQSLSVFLFLGLFRLLILSRSMVPIFF